ncbi:MAG: hypothetical protein V4671_20425 [Armatimonadota bacterium]
MKQIPVKAAFQSGSRGAMTQRGASLIEVMVILVILLIGLGTIIRIFPIGLSTLRTTETRTLAVQLANQQAEQLKADAQNLPQGVLLAFFDNNGNRVFDAQEDSDSLAPYKPAPNTPVNPYYTDVNKFRFIDGEVVKVPPPVITDDFGNASIYLVKFGPMFVSPAAGSSSTIDSTAINYLRVYSAPLQEITAPYRSFGTSATPPDNSGQVRGFLRGAQSYLLDPDDSEDDDGSGLAHIFLPPTTSAKVYLISYSYDAGGGVYRTVDKQLFPNATGTLGNQWETIVTPNSNGVLPGSVRVYRLFDRVTAAAGTPGTINWDPTDPTDPYQYALLSSNFIDGNGIATSANVGRIAFNPSGASYGQRNASGQQAFTAYIDYSVLDWHIMREDREVPSGIPGANNEVTVRTTLANLKRAGDPNPDNTLYDGMFGSGTQDLIVIDLQTGRELQSADYANIATTQGADYWINNDQNGTYRSGTIYINTLAGRVPRGSQIRILYKAEGDWAVAVQKAYSRYQGVATAFPAIDSPSSFTLGDGLSNVTRIYFNRSEYNKAFVAQFRYVVDDGNGGNRIIQTQPQQVTLAGVDGTPFTTANGVDYSFAEVGGNGGPDLMPNRKPGTGWQIVNNTAYGVSVKTRVIYRDTNSGRGANDADPSSGWRVQDVDTYLTRAY